MIIDREVFNLLIAAYGFGFLSALLIELYAKRMSKKFTEELKRKFEERP